MKEAHKGKGGPAFPFTMDAGPDGNVGYFGMSLRDYFAAKAMMAMYDHFARDLETCDGSGHDFNPELHADVVAEGCYELADAMLKARSK